MITYYNVAIHRHVMSPLNWAIIQFGIIRAIYVYKVDNQLKDHA
jgi:hypothetical protein